MTGLTLAQALRLGEILSRGLSQGRRQRCRTMLGDGRGFATDLDAIYLPWPLPAPLEAHLAPAIALQAAPSKDLLAQLPLARLTLRERHALQIVEGAEALGWARAQWPGLRAALDALCGGITPRLTAALSAAQMMDAAIAAMRDRHTLPPLIFGQLPIVRSAVVDLAARRAQLESRLPWSSKKRIEKLSNWSIAIGGGADEGTAAQRSGNSEDDDSDDRVATQRKSRLGTPYPEWHSGRQQYREHHVTVFETRRRPPLRRTERPDPRLIAWFEQPLERRWKQRLEDGSDLDIDGLVDVRIDELAGMRHRERLYRERLPAAREVAVALLIDRSGSLSMAEHLKHEIACANALTAAMERAGERYGVFAFWSDTRDHVAFEVLRDFDDGLPLQLDESSLRPRGYTRLGAALRHATARLLREPAERRVLLALGDAVPSDEGYEGPYAAADVQKAVEEAEQHAVTVSFIAIGRPRHDLLAELLPRHLVRVDSVEQLAPVLADVHARLAS